MKYTFDPRIKYEWWIYDDRVEVDLKHPIKKARKPNGVYAHMSTYEMYRYYFGTIADMHLLSTEEDD